jgi:hypothetical protein
MERIYVKRKGSHSLKDAVEMFPIPFDKAKQEIISKTKKQIKAKSPERKPARVEYNLKKGCDFKGTSYSFDGCVIDIGNIYYDSEVVKGKNSYLVEIIRASSSSKIHLDNLQEEFNLKGTFLS